MTVKIQFQDGTSMTFTNVAEDAILNQGRIVQLSGTHEGVTAGWIFNWSEVKWLNYQ